MINIASDVKIGPSFGGVVKYLIIMFVALFSILTLLDIALGKDPLGNVIKHWSNEESLWVGILIVVLLAVAAGVKAIGNKMSVFISADQMSGRAENGMKTSFPVSSVSRVEFRHNRYAPGLMIHSEKSEKAIFMMTLGLDSKKTLIELRESIGRNHVLTKWFEENFE